MLYRRAWSIGSGGKRAILITWAKMPSKTSGSSSTNFSINILFCACEGISNKCSFRLYPLSLLYVYLYYVYSTANQSGTAKKHYAICEFEPHHCHRHPWTGSQESKIGRALWVAYASSSVNQSDTSQSLVSVSSCMRKVQISLFTLGSFVCDAA